MFFLKTFLSVLFVASVSTVCVSGAFACDPGEYDNDGVCESCLAGSYCPGDGTMVACSGNTYSGDDASQCTACDVDTDKPYANNEHTQCVACNAANEYVDDGVCLICASGLYVDDEHQCVSCPAGKYCTGNGLATDCPIGYFNNQGGQTVCQQCNTGYTTTGTGATACNTCVAGYCTYTNGELVDSCKKCFAGYFCPSADVKCNLDGKPFGSLNGITDPHNEYYKCPRGYYSLAGATSCTACPVGTTTDEIGSTSGSLCKIAPINLYFGDSNTSVTLPKCLNAGKINTKVISRGEN